ncbi:hypothetical protein K466DRAFT_661929 [Polyporus arcularius HHB13444]|uniref:BTB domain-containing protein n=1 Tax=Polyporus arcularius HHB13444 TaxID=1314778 RepID=A0A5C3PH95_9APHY|nr:hypothetical protein K466DRAFT_661929 [Polyporus arcularius HHB13444]
MSSGPPLAADPLADEPNEDDLIRDTEFWFDAGSVVLVAGKVAFKVYRETLAVPSVVFQGLFQFPRNAAILTLDGCPLVQVSDSPEDFRHLLRVLFPRPTVGENDIPFPHVSAYIRLAHKYKMTSIWDDGVKLLMKYYDPRHDFWACRDGLGLLLIDPIHAIDAIHIARLTGAEIILPLAFLQCADVGPDLAFGYGREDGTRIFLTPEDLARVLRLRDKLRREADLHVLAHERCRFGPLLATCGATDACTSPNRCREAACTAWTNAVADRNGGDPLILRPWREIVEEVYGSMCPACRECLLRRDPLQDARRTLWTNLPRTIGIHVRMWSLMMKPPGEI